VVLDGQLLAVSPDGRKMCIFSSTHPQETFDFQKGRWVHEDLKRERDRLQVVELGTWSTIYSAS